MKREGSADSGVSFSLYGNACVALPDCMLLLFCSGGGGRANGFCGPVAPALRTPPAEDGDLILGDGGGSTTLLEAPRGRVPVTKPVLFPPPPPPGPAVALPEPEPRAEDSADSVVPLPATLRLTRAWGLGSGASPGIWTVRRGRLRSWRLLLRMCEPIPPPPAPPMADTDTVRMPGPPPGWKPVGWRAP